MSIAGTVDAPLSLFGGLVTDMPPADLPEGVSPDCQDLAFLLGSVKTRPGLLSVYSPIAWPAGFTPPGGPGGPGDLGLSGSNPTVNYLKTFTQPNLAQTLLALDSSGTLWGEESPGVLTQVASGIVPGCAACSISLFGREYMALSDGNFGLDLPRQYDGTNFDRVSQVGPGAGVAAIADIVVNISAIASVSSLVTVTTATPSGLVSTDSVTIAGVADATFDGTYPIVSIVDSLHFTFTLSGSDRSSSGGTAAPVGSIAAGVHQCSVIFVTRQGYLTRPSAPVSWTSIGNVRANVTGIPAPLGLTNIVARILAFTGAGGDNFYYTTGLDGAPQLQVNDNSATSFVVDFSDTALLAGVSADYLFQLVELGECAGVLGYSSRVFWWGERNRQPNWDNLTFDGGFGGAGNNVPLGWTPDATYFTGGSADSTGKAIWGGAYSILGDGVTATRGLMTQSAVTDYNGAPRLLPNTGYSARAHARMTGALTQGTLHVQLYSAMGSISTTGISVPAAQVNANAWIEFIAPITPAAGFATIPPDLVLRVYADGTPTGGAGFLVENIEIFPTAEPYNTSLVRASYADDPESFDGVTGYLGVSEDDGQTVRAAFVLRQNLYLVKDRSLYVTTDDGVNEPASWTINEVSVTVGTPSAAGVDTGEDWAVIAGRNGMYIFDGGDPVKISQEIQPLWDRINWAAGNTLWVRVDTLNKRILCGVPLDAATSPNRILVLDYRSLSDAAEIESLGSVLFSTLSGKLYAVGRSRKWCPWNITANSCALAERSDGTAQIFLGNGAGNGKIYQLSDTQFSDDGAAIDSYYTTYFFLTHDLEQSLQVRSHRKLFSYLTLYAEGAGNLNLSAFTDNEAYPTALSPLPLSSPSPKDLEMPINLLGERVAFQVGTNAAGAWFKLERFIPSLLPDPWAPVRGGN
jgi:hypothetical protein